MAFFVDLLVFDCLVMSPYRIKNHEICRKLGDFKLFDSWVIPYIESKTYILALTIV